ncbi:unnamed protein product [Blepharisma stoltei]|uniref:Uncharacterized protein n=1 Tax=Blepharisma stoltei TaxID=1481888 RepID=A0AAU9IG71_9CILI|nr:unnamed protein product [Blepharisma stoltei]
MNPENTQNQNDKTLSASQKINEVKAEKSEEIEKAKEEAAQIIVEKAENKIKNLTRLDDETQKELSRTASVAGTLLDPYLQGIKTLFRNLTNQEEIGNKWPKIYQNFELVNSKRNSFLINTPYFVRKAAFYGTTTIIFTLSSGIFKRFKRTLAFGVIGGLLICPEEFGFRSKS